MDTQTTKELLNAPQRGEIILYQTADGRTKIDVKLENETVWLTQAQIAALMGTNVPAISNTSQTFTNRENWTRVQPFPKWK